MEQQESFREQGDTSAADMARELKDQVSEKAHGLAEQAQEVAESQKGRLADGATGVAQALHHASEGLRADDQRTVGDYTEALAGQVEKVAQFLQARDLPTMAREVSGFARRQPALFLGGAFTLGMVAARFLKSSASEGTRTDRHIADQRDDERGSDDGLSQRATNPVGGFGPAPSGYASPDESAEEEAEARSEFPIGTPGGVPPLPTAPGGGL